MSESKSRRSRRIDWNDPKHPIYMMGRYLFILIAILIASSTTASNWDRTEIIMITIFAVILGFGEVLWQARKFLLGFLSHMLRFDIKQHTEDDGEPEPDARG